jgi:hypothetical protein
MIRRALLIDAGRAAPDDIIDGCSVDVKQLKAWLTSSAGGAWGEAEEIISLHNPTLAKIVQGKQWVDKADFAFVAFSGHGHINELNGRRHQAVIVGDSEEIDFDRLKPTTSKSIVTCDACRKVHVSGPTVKAFTENMQKSYAKAAAARYSREDYKREYLRLLGEADGRYTMYSCSPGQYSGDHEENGGRFTSMLLSCASIWYADTAGPMEHFTIGQAFGEAAPIVAAKSRAENAKYPQDPEVFSSIRGVSSKYPFVIHFE